MATVPQIDYPTSDGRPMAETDLHRELLLAVIETLKRWFAAQPSVYVSGNLLIFYVPGDKRRHVSPDVFVVFGVAKHRRLYYLLWEEGKGPDVAIELTSRSTRREDLETKFRLYRDVLKVREYFLFDPQAEYLNPPLQGYRLRKGEYTRIRARAGRLPSQVLGLHLEARGEQLRFYDPATGQWLPTPAEEEQQAQQARREAEAREQREAAARREAEAREQREAAARREAEAEVAQLRQALEALRRQQDQES